VEIDYVISTKQKKNSTGFSIYNNPWWRLFVSNKDASDSGVKFITLLDDPEKIE